jgi:hypothetical protein
MGEAHLEMKKNNLANDATFLFFEQNIHKANAEIPFQEDLILLLFQVHPKDTL